MACSTDASAVAILLVLLAALAGCESAPIGPPPATDRYEVCDAPEARAAIEDARVHLGRGEYADAVPLLQRALELCPEHVRTHLMYVDAALAVGGETAAAMRAAYRAVGDNTTSPLPPYLRARLADEEDYTRREELREAVKRDPSFYWAHLSMARLQRTLNRRAKALDALQAALSARPNFAEARLELAQVLAELGRYEEAEAEYANYLGVRPTDREVQREYVRLLIYQLGRGEQARPAAEQMLEDDPGDLDALMNLAAVYWQAGKPEVARDFYRRVLRADATQSRAVLNLGNLYYDQFARGSKDAKREAWAKARSAYRYYLSMERTDGIYDLADFHLSVPYRLKAIDEFLGDDGGRLPSLDDL